MSIIGIDVLTIPNDLILLRAKSASFIVPSFMSTEMVFGVVFSGLQLAAFSVIQRIFRQIIVVYYLLIMFN